VENNPDYSKKKPLRVFEKRQFGFIENGIALNPQLPQRGGTQIGIA